jgi:hypothetical protein
MSTTSTIILRVIAPALLLLAASACSGPQTNNAPSMLDYSYIPPSGVATSNANYGIDDF